MLKRTIGSTNEQIPVIGLGTWQVFDVTSNDNKEPLKHVLQTMHKAGGRLIDSSPMYGRSEEVVGELTQSSGIADQFFYATKVWIEGKQQGIRQMEDSMRKMKRGTIDLMQIHNLVDWKTHYETLQQWKAEGKIRYIGITHYTDAMQDELVKVINDVPVDFVQFNYSAASRHAEKRLLPAVADKGVATLINRPFRDGELFSKVKGKQLPDWASEYNIDSWAQLFLKFIISHPAVTCVIPATSKAVNAADNMKAGEGALLDEAARKKIGQFIRSL